MFVVPPNSFWLVPITRMNRQQNTAATKTTMEVPVRCW